jgi:hypothetical protein
MLALDHAVNDLVEGSSWFRTGWRRGLYRGRLRRGGSRSRGALGRRGCRRIRLCRRRRGSGRGRACLGLWGRLFSGRSRRGWSCCRRSRCIRCGSCGRRCLACGVWLGFCGGCRILSCDEERCQHQAQIAKGPANTEKFSIHNEASGQLEDNVKYSRRVGCLSVSCGGLEPDLFCGFYCRLVKAVS